MSRNQLDQETSPYLLLHKDNPVHWRPWGPDALAEAEASNKPILLSIGYTACHWCHVMNEESFSDQSTADIINESYIPIKVDREERPDVDLLYQTSANTMGGQGGWPLTVFLTPRGEPYFIGTYFPPTTQPALSSFSIVLTDLAKLYREQNDKVLESNAVVRASLSNLWTRNLRGPLNLESIDMSAVRIGQRFDMFAGGFTGAPKFPSFAHIQALQRAYLRSGIPVFNQLVQTTLERICLGGIYDHLGGGIARYSTDEYWLAPHFEKMLYDNAFFIDTLTLAWQLDRNPLYRSRIEETAQWALREMMVDDGFASTIDADSEGEEGKFYLWTEAEIDAALAGTYAQKFKSVYGVSSVGNYKGRTILNRLNAESKFGTSPADEALFAKQRQALFAVREKRVRPICDDKVQADWNGMMISALANAGSVLRNTAWTMTAARAFEFVEKALGDGDRLFHSWRAGKRHHTGFAEDYVHMAHAATTLYEVIGDTRYLKRAQAWMRTLDEYFWDQQNGGYFQTPADAEPLPFRARSVFDQFIPSANGLAPQVLTQLYLTTMDGAYRNRSNAVVDAFSGEVERAFLSMPTYLASLEHVVANIQIVIVGPLTNPKTHELAAAVRGRALPNKFCIVVSPDQRLPEGHPAHGKAMVNGQPAAYVCQRQTCSQPITNPVQLSQLLLLPPRPQDTAMAAPVGSA